MRVEDGFQPVPPPALHPYADDPVVPNLLKRLIPDSYRAEIESDLFRFGNDIRGYIRDLTPLVRPPTLTQYDQWGRRIDRLDTSEGWRKLKDIAISEGLVAIAHERKFREHSRIYSFAKLTVFNGDGHVIMCPLSMSDGAARVIELLGTEDMKRDLRSRLISRDPSHAFTSGQWMTERPGGSDVSQTETTAIPLEKPAFSSTLGPLYTLSGFKWFSSATDSDISLALARTGNPSLGSRSLSLFLVPLRLPLLPIPGPSSTSNGILVHRLKDKFGTQALPTAELSLNDTEGYLVGPLNDGVRSITPVLNITRIHSAVSSLGYLSRAFATARSYATVRSITVPGNGGNDRTQRLLKDIPLHMAGLADVAVTYHALTHLTFGAISLLGKSECGIADRDEETRLRLLTPVVKAFVAERAVSAVQKCMESLGGQGYMEENAIARYIRDGTVERIWEGTLNVLSLDFVRVSRREEGMLPFINWGTAILATVPAQLEQTASLQESLRSLKTSLETISKTLYKSYISPLAMVPVMFLFAHVAAALYLLEHVVWGHNNRATYSSWHTESEIFKRWTESLDAVLLEVQRVSVLGEGSDREGKNFEFVYGTSGPFGGRVKL